MPRIVDNQVKSQPTKFSKFFLKCLCMWAQTCYFLLYVIKKYNGVALHNKVYTIFREKRPNILKFLLGRQKERGDPVSSDFFSGK